MEFSSDTLPALPFRSVALVAECGRSASASYPPYMVQQGTRLVEGRALEFPLLFKIGPNPRPWFMHISYRPRQADHRHIEVAALNQFPASLLSQWFVTYFVVGRTPSSAPDPWSGISNTLKAKADEGVGHGPGGPPHFAKIFNKLLGQETRRFVVKSYVYRVIAVAREAPATMSCAKNAANALSTAPSY